MNDEPKPTTTVLGGIPATVQVGVDGAERLSRLTPLQVVTIAALASMCIGMGLTVFLVINVINDKAASETRWQTHSDTLGRSNDEQREMDRKHQLLIAERASRDTDGRLKMVLEHCAEQERKNRESDSMQWEKVTRYLTILAAEVAKFVPLKKTIEEPESFLPHPFIGPIPDVMPAIAPHPRKVRVDPTTAG